MIKGNIQWKNTTNSSVKGKIKSRFRACMGRVQADFRKTPDVTFRQVDSHFSFSKAL